MTEVGSSIEIAARYIIRGEVVAFPTETSYGLGASIYNEMGLRRIYEIKKRPLSKPLLVLISRVEWLHEITNSITPYERRLIERFWPGPLTILFDAKDGLAQYLKNKRGQVAVRLTAHETARRLIDACGVPITGTSANLSGHTPAKSAHEVLMGLDIQGGALAYVLDGGELPPGPPSTIVDPSTTPCTILRRGAVSEEDILAVH